MRPFVELMARNRVVVRLDAARVRSWDHRKLGLDPLPLGGSTAPPSRSSQLRPAAPVISVAQEQADGGLEVLAGLGRRWNGR